MKKIIALFLCITLTGSVSVFAEQVNSPNNRGMENQEHTINVRDLSTVSAVSVGEGRIDVPSLQKVIDSYFSARENHSETLMQMHQTAICTIRQAIESVAQNKIALIC